MEQEIKVGAKKNAMNTNKRENSSMDMGILRFFKMIHEELGKRFAGTCQFDEAPQFLLFCDV